MHHLVEDRIKRIRSSGRHHTLSESKIGLEREALRESNTGGISKKQHPVALGSPLTNPYITTDFSEALTEIITPPCGSVDEVLQFLHDIHLFVYKNLEDEKLWAASMPCIVDGESSIRIAQYGTSNSGKMKTVYREGLSHRYGKMMQVIAGIHFNYSLSDDFWSLYQEMEGDESVLKDFKSERYMDMIRNILRNGWIVPYLFGASPAICKSFTEGLPVKLTEYNEGTLYEPYATSLRMGDIGYTNSKENVVGVKANYDSLEAYVSSLRCAISTPFEGYQKIGLKEGGESKQLNCNILQIENEYYSTARPKQILDGNEKPTTALSSRGIEYVELRSLDVNVFEPLGVNAEQLYFLETFMIYCLLEESETLAEGDIKEIDENLLWVAHNGRNLGLTLKRRGEEVALKAWASDIFAAMAPVADLLDEVNDSKKYSDSLHKLSECITDHEKTISARILDEMRLNNEGFFPFSDRMSDQHAEYFTPLSLTKERREFFERSVADSFARQKDIEEREEMIEFDDFLADYFEKG